MNGSILYLGDTSLETAAAYLAGVMHHAGWNFRYLPSDQLVTPALLEERRSLYILSDYPSAQFPTELQEQMLLHVKAGSGLLMCGGWESFHGLGGDWGGTPVGEILPVEISPTDDRQNCDHPVLIRRRCEHPILADLPWESRPPLIGGFNRVTAKSDATVLLEAEHFSVERDGEKFQFTPTACDPLLVVGKYGTGRIAAFMTDVAPHWVGPLVDWGESRISAQANGAEEIEVGNRYDQFLRQLIGWVKSNESS
ncbi:MAG: hypothetical protein Tsb009_25030 [Planctomycetaceae bacterium]